MKKLRNISAILLLSLMMGGLTSCEMSRHSEEGRHRGWSQKHDDDEHNKGAVIVIKKDNKDNRSDEDHDH